jgi:hypothetical protein
MREKCVFYCFKVFFENPNFGGSYLEIGKKANAGFCFSLSYIVPDCPTREKYLK